MIFETITGTASQIGDKCVIDSNCFSIVKDEQDQEVSHDVYTQSKYSVTYEVKKKKKYEYCLLFNLCLQLIVIIMILGSVFAFEWLSYESFGCLPKPKNQFTPESNTNNITGPIQD